jgi:hypothetical protein
VRKFNRASAQPRFLIFLRVPDAFATNAARIDAKLNPTKVHSTHGSLHAPGLVSQIFASGIDATEHRIEVMIQVHAEAGVAKSASGSGAGSSGGNARPPQAGQESLAAQSFAPQLAHR